MTGALTVVVSALAAAVLLLVQFIIAIRALAISRKRRDRRLRPATELSLAEYLAGSGATPAPAGRDERAVFLAVALDALADLRGGERARLIALLDRLGYTGDAMSRLRSRHRVVRQRAAETLATIASPTALPALRAALGDRDVLVRLACARMVAELGGEEDAPGVVAAVKRDLDAAPGAAAAVVLALGTTRPPDIAPLLGPEAPPKVRAAATLVAGELRLAALAPQLRSCLHNGDDLAASAARGLGRIGDVDAVPLLARLAEDERRAPLARVAAAAALGSIGDTSAVGVLERLLSSGDWPLLAASTEALTQLGEPGTACLRRAASGGRADVTELALAMLEQ